MIIYTCVNELVVLVNSGSIIYLLNLFLTSYNVAVTMSKIP